MKKIIRLLWKNKAKTENKNSAKAESPALLGASAEELGLLKELGDVLVGIMGEEARRFDNLTQQFFSSDEKQEQQSVSSFLSEHWEKREARIFGAAQEYIERMGEECQSSWKGTCQWAKESLSFLLSPVEVLLFIFKDDASKRILTDARDRLRSETAKWWKRFMMEGVKTWKPIRIVHGDYNSMGNCLGYDEEFEVFVEISYRDKYIPFVHDHFFSAESPEWVQKEHYTLKKYPAKVPSRAVSAYYQETDREYYPELQRGCLDFIKARVRQ